MRRIYSMYGRSKRILYINGTIFAMCIAAAAAVVATFFPQEQCTFRIVDIVRR